MTGANRSLSGLVLVALIFSAAVLVTFLTMYARNPAIRQIIRRPDTCQTGQLDSFPDKDFVDLHGADDGRGFYSQIDRALVNIRQQGGDYNLSGILYTGGSLLGHYPYFYFVSSSLGKVATTNGTDIVYSDEDRFASDRLVLTDTQIKSVIPPVEAVTIAKPVLNCYRDYPDSLSRKLSLGIDSKSHKVIWIVTAEDVIQSVPGPFVSHSVDLDAMTGEILHYQ